MIRAVRLLMLIGCAVALTACFPGNWSWHQKLTIVVDTPEGERSGSSTVRVGWTDVNIVSNYSSSYSGEATVVDLGQGKHLFALMSEQTKYLGFRTFFGDAGIGADRFTRMAQLRGAKPVPIDHYPLLVTFDDITKPETVKEVNPNDLAAAFGPGYALKSITLEITDDPVTEGEVEQVLGWMLDPKVMRNPGWKTIPIEARRLLSGYIKPFPKLGDKK